MRSINRGLSIAGLLAVGVLAFGACKGDSTTVNTPSASDTTGITVSGHGEVQAVPDTAFLNIGVQSTAANVADARERAAKAADAVISSLKKNGVADKDIQTTGLSIQPQYDYKNPGEPRITGYVVSNTVTARVRKLDTLSTIIDDGVAAGGDDVRLQGISFKVEDNAKVLEQAREAAMKDAKSKADQLAKLGGVKLGAPQAITETQSTPPQPLAADSMRAQAAAGGTATPIQPGTNSITVDVQVRWGIG